VGIPGQISESSSGFEAYTYNKNVSTVFRAKRAPRDRFAADSDIQAESAFLLHAVAYNHDL
jgi:hypothetical protein